MSFNIMPDSQVEYVQQEVDEAYELGHKQGFEEGYEMAQQEVENLIQPYRFDPMLWDKIIKWAQKKNV